MTLTVQQREHIIEMYKKGANISQIALTLNITRKTVRKYLKAYYNKQLQEADQRFQGEGIATAQSQAQQPAIMTVKSPISPILTFLQDPEGEIIARIIAKYELSQPLKMEEIYFLANSIKKNFIDYDKILKEGTKQEIGDDAKQAYIARLSGIIEDALVLGLELLNIEKDYKEFCKSHYMTFPELVRVAITLYYNKAKT
jgi:IS30 family transposase